MPGTLTLMTMRCGHAYFVIVGHDPANHHRAVAGTGGWMPGSSPGMTDRAAKCSRRDGAKIMKSAVEAQTRQKKVLKGIFDIRRFFHRNEIPILFISATNFNLLGMDEWCKNFKIWFPPARLRNRVDNKINTVRIGNQAGVPSVPNVLAAVRSYDELRRVARDLGSDLVVQSAYGDSAIPLYSSPPSATGGGTPAKSSPPAR
jgi:hypothetical protein